MPIDESKDYARAGSAFRMTRVTRVLAMQVDSSRPLRRSWRAQGAGRSRPQPSQPHACDGPHWIELGGSAKAHTERHT